MGSRICCCFGRNINEDQQGNGKETIKRDIIQQKALASDTEVDDVVARKTSTQNQLKATQHVTSKASNSNPEVDEKPELQPPSISCPQLTVDEMECIDDNTNNANDIMRFKNRFRGTESTQGSESSLKHRLAENQLQQQYNLHDDRNGNEATWISNPSKSLLTKTYSFKRIISFRSDNFRRGNSRSVMGNSHSPKNIGRCSPSPFYLKDPYRGGGVGPQQPYKPLTFSFLGQIYAKKSIKGDKTELSYSKRKLEAKLSSPANICDEAATTNFREESSPVAEPFTEDDQ